MMLRNGKQIITINILPSISKSEGNVAIKFGQLIEFHMRRIFLLKIIHKKHKVHISASTVQKFFISQVLNSLILLHVQV